MVLSKAKSAIATTGKAIGAGILVVGFFIVKACLNNNNNNDDDDCKTGFDANTLWHEGYGFNNPNNERIKNGQPVLNFDGSVAD